MLYELLYICESYSITYSEDKYALLMGVGNMAGSRKSLTLLSLLILASTIMSVGIVVAEREGLKPWIINDYGGLVVIKINRLLFKDLGDGYWLLVLPDTKYSEFADEALNQIAPYLHIGKPKILLHVTWTGKTFIIKVNETRSLSRNIWEIHKRIEKFLKNIGRRGLAPAEMKMFIEDNDTYIVIGGAGKLSVDEFAKLAHQYFKDFSKKVIVVEKFGWLPPGGPYQRMEMLNALRKVPCFFSFGEAVYGTSMIFNASCVKEMARKKNIACDDAVEHIVGKVKKLNPLIRKYLPWQEILIVIAKTPKLIIPTGMTLINTSKPSPEVQVETTQTEKQSQNTMITATYYEEEYTVPPQLMLITLIIIAVIIIVTVTIKYKVA